MRRMPWIVSHRASQRARVRTGMAGACGLLCILLLCLANPSLATTKCQQTFMFLAQTQSSWRDPVIWIVEDINGACWTTNLIQVVLRGEEPFVINTSLKGYKDWGWLKEGTERMRTERFVELENDSGTWRDKTGAWHLKAPAFSQEMADLWKKELRQHMSHAPEWHQVYGLEGVMLPEFYERQWNLLYYYPTGLYINYDIDMAYYFPKSEHLLVFTHQPVSASGLDTMHGFMLFGEVQADSTEPLGHE
jgi:hypothetical protein